MKSTKKPAAANLPAVSKGARPLVYLSALTVALAGVAAMGLCALTNDYTGLDVKKFIVDSPFLVRTTLNSIWLCLIGRAFPEDAYYPVFQISLGMDLTLFRATPRWSAVVNVALHVANALLVWKLGRVFFERDAKMSPGRSLAAATVAAILFAVHPVNVEPVAWVCGRKVLLAFFFSALSLLLLLKERVKPLDAVLAGFFFLLSTFSNALSLGVPFVAFAYFLMVRRKSWRGAALAAGPLFLVLIFSGSLRTFHNRVELAGFKDPFVFNREVATTLRGQLEQAFSLVYPSNLSHLYRFEKPPFWTAGTHLGIAAILASAAIVIVLWRRSSSLVRAVNFAFVAYWLALSPAFLHHFARADRHLYFPAVGLFFLVGIGFADLFSRLPRRRDAWVLGGIAVLAAATPLILVSRSLTRIWWGNVSLFEHVVKVAPENPKALGNLALHLLPIGELERAKQLYFKAIDLAPGQAETYLNLALIYVEEGNLDMAIENYKKGLRLDNKDAKAYSFLANALEKKGLHEEALECFKRDLELAPHLARPYVNLAVLAGRNGDLPTAKSYFDQALKIEPRSAQIFYNYAVVLENNGDKENAVRYYTQALKLDPRHAQAHNNIGAIYAARDEADMAILHFEKAVELDPELILTRANLGFMLIKKGKTDEAISVLRAVLKRAREIGNQALAEDVRKRLENLGVSAETEEQATSQTATQAGPGKQE